MNFAKMTPAEKKAYDYAFDVITRHSPPAALLINEPVGGFLLG
jgi:hypothetical protein